MNTEAINAVFENFGLSGTCSENSGGLVIIKIHEGKVDFRMADGSPVVQVTRRMIPLFEGKAREALEALAEALPGISMTIMVGGYVKPYQLN